MRIFHEDEAAGVLIETALVLPAVLMLLLGLIEAAIALAVAAAFERAAFGAGAILHSGGTADDAAAYIAAAVSLVVHVDPSQVSVSGEDASLAHSFRIAPGAASLGRLVFRAKLGDVVSAE